MKMISLKQKIKIKQFLPIILIVLVALFAMQALVHPGFYTNHDGWHQVARLYHFDKALREGQFPPRWSGDLYHGFGYPLFIFSYHLPWILAEPFVLAGTSIFDAIKVVFILTFVLSGLVMYGWISEMWGKKAGFVAAFIYLFTPYHIGTILVRANIGEAVSFAFFPLIFWALFRLQNKITPKTIVLGAVGITGVLLSHVMVVYLFFIPLVLTFFYHWFVSKQRKKYFFSNLQMILLGISLAGYYILPAVMYQGSIVLKGIYQDLYTHHFTSLTKLIYSPWGYGQIDTPGEMSRQVGLIIWVIAGVSLLLALYHLLPSRKEARRTHYTLIFLFTLASSIFLMTSYSLPLWKYFTKFVFIDFPWRFLSVTTLSGAVLAGFLIAAIKNRRMQLIVSGLLIILAFYTNRNHLRVNQYTDIPLWLYVDSETTTNTDDEYLPKWVDRKVAQTPEPKVKLEGTYSDFHQDSKNINFTVNVNGSGEVTLHHMDFPGMQTWVDENPVIYQRKQGGQIQFLLTPGIHKVRLEYKGSLIMYIGNVVSILALGMIFFLVFKKNRKI